MGTNLSAGLLSPPPLLHHPHISSVVASQSLPLSLSIAFTCVTRHVLPWRSLMLPPHYVSSGRMRMKLTSGWWCRQAADVITSLGKSLFLPLGTMYTKLPSIFMEPRLIPAFQENICPHTLHLLLHSSYRNSVALDEYFLYNELWWPHTTEVLFFVFFLSYQREISLRPSSSRTGLSQEGLPKSAIIEISLYAIHAGCVCGHYMRHEMLKIHEMTRETASIGMFIFPHPFRSPFAF